MHKALKRWQDQHKERAMSIAEIERFATDLQSDEALRAAAATAQAEKSHAGPMERAAAFAASKGYSFTADEAKDHAKARTKAKGKELTDAELDGVAGGVCFCAAGNCMFR